MDDIVRRMRVFEGDPPIPSIGYILRADDAAIDVYSDNVHGDRFTCSVAETVLRGTWELLAGYGFSSIYITDIFLGSQAAENRIGHLAVERTGPTALWPTAVSAATDT